jgi:hypothetical protein
MMGENLSVGSVYNVIDRITPLEVDSHNQQSIPIFNKSTAVAALASSTLISTLKRLLNEGNNNNNNNALLMFLFSVIGLSLLSLSMSATMANAQTPSDSTAGSNSNSNEIDVKQMGICQVGAGGPCNGDSNSPK